MSDPLLTKRLHISGLTPAITTEDLERRLSSFGKVRAMDGFGARDALGDPRKFGFVTMEIGAKDLGKCLSALSGSTWKGAKLRIGEAKPDFRERLAQINSQPSQPIRPKRTRACGHGRPSSILPLTPLSAVAAASAPGWIVTPSGRVIRPMRMRPERPLEPMRNDLAASGVKGINGKAKKRIKPPPIRARRRLIDPTKWDSVYLKGVFLDSIPVSFPTSRHDAVDEHTEEETDDVDPDSDVPFTPLQPASPLVQYRASTIPSVSKLPEAAVASHEGTEPIDVRDEADAALAMMSRMFGDKEDWDGRESVDEMEDLEDREAEAEEMQGDKDDIEVVSRNFGEGEKSKIVKEMGEDFRFGDEEDVDVRGVLDEDIEMENIPSVAAEVSAQTVKPAPRTNLKALFAPKEEASFSLINHLDLELELDADMLGISAPPATSQENGHLSHATLSIPQVVEIPATKSTVKARSRVTLDPSLPLLFPTQDSLPHPYTLSKSENTTHRHGTPSCFLFPSAARVRGLNYLPSSGTFTRSPEDTSESIRERWEKDKSSLTREWKKAWREARGSKKGRFGAGGEIGGGY